MAERENPGVQMLLLMAEIAGHLQQGVGHLMRQVGLELMGLVMAEEVKQLVGERHAPSEDRRSYCWGQEDGYGVVDGRKVPLAR